MSWWVQLLIAIVMQIASVALSPKPKGAKPTAVEDFNDPTASADREVPVLFGEMTIRDPNIIWFGDKAVRNYEVK